MDAMLILVKISHWNQKHEWDNLGREYRLRREGNRGMSLEDFWHWKTQETGVELKSWVVGGPYACLIPWTQLDKYEIILNTQ